jgi:hypothetical protein
MFEDGVAKALAGLTSLEEVHRVTEDKVSDQFPGQDNLNLTSQKVD